MLKSRLAKVFLVITPWCILASHVGPELGWTFLTHILVGGILGGITSALVVSPEKELEDATAKPRSNLD